MSENINKLKEEINKLPSGYISNKTINGKLRHYLQWTENGKVKSKYIPFDDYEEIKQKIELRKKLQKELNILLLNSNQSLNKNDLGFEMNVVVGDDLRNLTNLVRGYKKRDCFNDIQTYIYGKPSPRICSLYGLRRTGKTTLLLQTINEMSEDYFNKTAYIKARKNQSMIMLDRDLKLLFEKGYRFIFIDEVTFLDDFIDTASFLSDIYAGMGMKIVLSGTDSLGFWFAQNEELYDRCYLIHTTWIPFGEHSRLLNVNDIDEYIQFGGTLRVGANDFDDIELQSEDVSFRDDESTRRYIDTAICKNIQHSLRCYEDGLHFRYLKDLYEANELTGAINRIIESMNHRFVLKVLNDDFKSSDLNLAKKNILREKDKNLRTDILDKIDSQSVINRLMEILEIENIDTRKVKTTDEHVKEIEKFLKALELIEDYPVRYDVENRNIQTDNKLFLQPGMRYCQAQALVYSLKSDDIFSKLNALEREYVCERILNEVKGRMLEEIVLYETMKKTGKENEVFKLQFVSGEFDMVIYDKVKHSCSIFEIKHSDKINSDQAKHLLNDDLCKKVESLYGNIEDKCVLYRGENITLDNGIKYLNVSEYLKTL